MPELQSDVTEFLLPDLGEGLTNAEIVCWHVGEGDHVVEGQPLVSVETDKAVVEVPAPRSGDILTVHGEVGELVEVGDVLVTFVGAGAAPRDAGTVVGELPESASSTEPTEATEATETKQKTLHRGRSQTAGRVKASPKARQRARELGIELASVVPSAAQGVIQVADVEATAGRSTQPPATAHATLRANLRGVRRAMADRMADAHQRVARASVTGEADISTWSKDCRTMTRLIRAVGAACAEEPHLNARFDDAAGTLTAAATVDLGVAMETEDGLFAPVLRDVRSQTDAELAAELGRLKTAVADRTIEPGALRGQTITLSNFGAVGGLHAEMIVVPPQVAIVGAGRSFERLVRRGDDVADATYLPLSITFDHRVVTGVEACRFLAALTADLEMAE
jgi:pyruvate dehydrogenase E2 component (dihydrolipoamide acetyltransferase)